MESKHKNLTLSGITSLNFLFIINAALMVGVSIYLTSHFYETLFPTRLGGAGAFAISQTSLIATPLLTRRYQILRAYLFPSSVLWWVSFSYSRVLCLVRHLKKHLVRFQSIISLDA